MVVVPSAKADAYGVLSVSFLTTVLAPVPSGTYTVKATGTSGKSASFSWTKEKK